LGIIDFEKYETCIKRAESDECGFKIVISGKERKLKFLAKTRAEADKWFFNIKKHIDSSEGVKKKIKLKNDDEKPWKFDQITE
jgi:hypothetical protein